MRNIVKLTLSIILLLLLSTTPYAQDITLVGPEYGSLVIVGGGRVGDDILNKFAELTGGKDAPIVIIPTAGGGSNYDENYRGLNMFRRAGFTNLTVVHTYDPKVADTEEFADKLKDARGVWFPGGRQWRLSDAYLETKTHKALFDVLERGGAIGGSSAGASIQATYMVRGAPEGNTIMMAKGHEKGLGFIRNVAIDQHVNTRNRFNDLVDVVNKYPGLLGIGLYESTAIVVQGDIFEVVGTGNVAIYDKTREVLPDEKPWFELSPGKRYNLAERKIIN